MLRAYLVVFVPGTEKIGVVCKFLHESHREPKLNKFAVLVLFIVTILIQGVGHVKQ